MTDEAFRTDDMTLVAVLTMYKFKHRVETVQGLGGRKRANWLFSSEDSSSEKFKDVLRQYLARTLKVEPQIFVLTLRKVRGAMYEEIGPPQRSESLRAASSA